MKAPVLDRKGPEQVLSVPTEASLREGPESRSFFLRGRFRKKMLVLLLLMMPGSVDKPHKTVSSSPNQETLVAPISSAAPVTLPPLQLYAPAQTSGVKTLVQQWFVNRDSVDQNALLARIGGLFQGMQVHLGPSVIPVRRESTTDDEGLVAYGFPAGVEVVVIESSGASTLYVLPTGDVYEMPLEFAGR